MRDLLRLGPSHFTPPVRIRTLVGYSAQPDARWTHTMLFREDFTV
jgi:hypothetical protein